MKALITGASSGIGKDMAIYLNQLGMDLVLVARTKEKLEELKKQLEEKDGNVQIISVDVGIAENCVELYREVKDIDILINNAGFGLFGEFESSSLIEEMNMINTNICALHTLTKLYLQDMVKKDFGYILNVSSIAGFVPGPLMSTYYSTKAYVLRFTQSIHEELKQNGSNVSVSVLCPGPTNTKFFETAGAQVKMSYTSSEYVAKYGIDKMLKEKLVIIPGIKNKIAIFLSRMVPDRVVSKVIYQIQRKRE